MDIFYENKTLMIEYNNDHMLMNKPHMHKAFEIIYVRKGQTIAYADNNSYMLNPGDTFISFPNQIHYYDTVHSGEFMVIIFMPEIVYEYGAQLSKSVPDTNYIQASDSKNISSVFNKIYKAEGDYKYLAINGYINVIMSMILPHLKLKTVSAENNSTIHSIMDFCSHNFKENVTLDLIAENLHLSKYYISHLINKRLNLSFNEYINSLRISEACALLKQNKIKIADISEAVGFGTIRSFNRSFKRAMGISPLEYRNSILALKQTGIEP